MANQSKLQLLVTDPRSLWTPAQLPGILNWWRSDLGITQSSGQVSAWRDQINGSTFRQSNSSNQPDYNPTRLAYNNKPTLEFVNADQIFMTAPGITYLPGDDMSIIVVGNILGQGRTLLSNGNNGAARFDTSFGTLPQPVSINLGGTFSNTTFKTVGIDAENPFVAGFTYSNVGAPNDLVKVFHDSYDLITYGPTAYPNANPGIRSYEPLCLGVYKASGTNVVGSYLDGEVAEIIVTKSYLSEQDLQPLIDYIYLRYGIGASTLEDPKVYLDLYDADPMLLNFQIDDYQELPTISSNFSRTFRIPATGTNNKFFQNAFYVNSTDYDVSVKVPAEIFVDGEFFRKGQIRLNRIYTNEFSDRTDYEIFFLGESKDFAGQVGEGFLNSLLCFDLNHELLMANIVTSWNAVAGTSNGLLSGDVVYPLVDMGYSWNDDGTPIENQIGIVSSNVGYSKPFTVGANRIERTYFRPWIRAKYLIDKIFEGTDYTYTSNFFTSNLFDGLYVNATGNTAQATINTEIGSSEFEVIQSGQTLEIVSGIPTVIEYPITISDPSDVMGLTTFTALTTGTHVFEYTTEIRTVLTGSNVITHTYLYQRNNGALTTIGTYTSPGSVSNLTTSFTTDPSYVGPGTTVLLSTLSLSLNAGDIVRWYVRSNHAPTAASSVTLPFSQLICTQSPIQIANPCALLQDNVKTIDFFKSIVNLFKLVVAPDPENDNNLIIEPYNDYIGSGTLRDWTDKLDTSVDFQIEPIFFSNTATIKFAYQADADFFNLDNETKFKEVFGTYIYDSQQELLNDQRTVEPVFSPTILSPIVGATGTTDFVLPRLVSIESDENAQASNNYAKVVPIRPNLRLCFYNGKLNGGHTWYYDTDLGATGTATTYPLMSPYLQPPGATGATGLNLNFEDELPYYLETASNFVTGQPTVYDEYWSEFINEQYSPFARKFTGNFVLNHYDLKDFQFSDVIFVRDSYYRVLKIKDVQVGETNSTQVELLKLLNYKVDILSPVASFIWEWDDANATVNLIDTSTNVTSWSWTTSAGTLSDPNANNPTISGLDIMDTITVTLTASNAFGSDIDSQTFKIVPVQNPNVIAWWRADVGVTLNGSDVSNWDDLYSGTYTLAQATAANQPVYNATDATFNNKPSIDFNGANQEYITSTGLQADFGVGDDFTMITVWKWDTLSANTDVVGGHSRAAVVNGRPAILNIAPAAITSFNASGYASPSVLITLQNARDLDPHILGLTYDANTGAYAGLFDSTTPVTGTGTTNVAINALSAHTFGVGNQSGGLPPDGNYADGRLAEIIYVQQYLTGTSLTDFTNYLTSRYNL